MGQKVSPTGFRTGITLGWQSTWYASKMDYGNFLVEDQKMRKYLDDKYNRQMPKAGIAKIEIVRTRNEVKVTLFCARPGIIIGARGGEVDVLKNELEKVTGRKVNVNVVEVKEPDLNAKLIGDIIAEQLCKRASFRRVMKTECENVMNAGAKGVKIMISGRLAGAEIARSESMKVGSVPLQTLDADVDYAQSTAFTTFGAIGIKVWIHRGKFGEQIEPQVRAKRRPSRRRHDGGHDSRQSSAGEANPAQPQRSS